MRPLYYVVTINVILLAFDSASAQTVLYVDADSPTDGPGSGWHDAFHFLQDAIAAASEGDEIRIASGTYFPDESSAVPQGTGDRSSSFYVDHAISIHGGYAGYGAADPDDRDPDDYVTVLDGDLLGDDVPGWGNRSDNSFHVVRLNFGKKMMGTMVLSYVTLSGGYADNTAPSPNGGGLQLVGEFSLTSSVRLKQITITDNFARQGGGIFADYRQLSVTNSRLFGNSSQLKGGAIFARVNDFDLQQSALIGNYAGESGSAVKYSGHQAVVRECTIADNRSGLGSAVAFPLKSYIQPSVQNSIIWGNTHTNVQLESSITPTIGINVQFCNIQDSYSGDGNFSADPAFVSTGTWENNGTEDPIDDYWTTGDYHLTGDSPCINAGLNALLLSDSVTDIEGEPRIQQCRVDLGFDESPFWTQDCNKNGKADACDISSSDDSDCDGDLILDSCQSGGLEDCNGDGVTNLCEIFIDGIPDCNFNLIPDPCETVPTGIIYVDQSATDGQNTGIDWPNAFLELSDALAFASCAADRIDEVHVAQGTYMPDTSNLEYIEEAAFELTNTVAVYGGFPSGGSEMSERDPRYYETIASGALDEATHATHVFRHPPDLFLDESAVLDGFVITGGYANCTPYDPLSSLNCFGGGMSSFGSPTLRHCEFRDNHAKHQGGAISFAFAATSGPIEHCHFENNSASTGGAISLHGGLTIRNSSFAHNLSTGGYYDSGGAIFSYDGPLVVEDSQFVDNRAADGPFSSGGAIAIAGDVCEEVSEIRNSYFYDNWAPDGGAIHNENELRIFNSVFEGNMADRGGALQHSDGNLQILNCTFTDNTEYGIDFWNSNALLENSIFWNNTPATYSPEWASPLVSHSCIDDGMPNDGLVHMGTGNIDSDPVFVGPDNLRLSAESPCIDAGNNDVPLLLDSDIDGNPRILCGVIDIGAYEFGMGDYTCDGYIDLDDLPGLVSCLSGPGVTPMADYCETFDVSLDGDVDLSDIAGLDWE